MIVIAKASREEGQLSEDVEAFIESTLHLRTKIPALELLDDGTVVGGSIQDGKTDVLQSQQVLKDKHPGVVVGPDTQPTLSFTSGSEGIPKGCKYVKFPLLSRYPFARYGSGTVLRAKALQSPLKIAMRSQENNANPGIIIRGRHFSLTYYQAFMAERFRMGAHERFTMLSGIAHVCTVNSEWHKASEGLSL